MTTRSTLTLRGNRNQCPACGEHFNSNTAFDMHRTGAHEANQRRCLTPDEMRMKGMLQRGPWWMTEAREVAGEDA